jgi:hypothetical protein
VALYTDEGDRIHFKRGGTIEVRAASQVLVQAPSMVLEGDLQVGGSLTVQSSAMVLGQATVLGPLLGQSTITAGAEIVAGSLGAPLGLLAFRAIYNSHVHGLSPTPTPTA